MKNSVYVLTDWAASGISFLSLMAIYRYCGDMNALGEAGWLLNLLLTCLSIPVAAQYTIILRDYNVWNTYISFIPLVLVEILFLATRVEHIYLIIIATCLFSAMMSACFRGFLIGRGQLSTAARWNFVEQLGRFFFVLLAIKTGIKPDIALLISPLASYIITSVSSFFILKIKFRHPAPSLSEIKFVFSEAIWFSVIHGGIYLITNVDVLALKGHPDKNQFVLLKPWGQILYSAILPFINIYLTKMKDKARESFFVLIYIFLFFILYCIVMYTGVNRISSFIFNKEVIVESLVFAVILEHFFLCFLVIQLYRLLYKQKHLSQLIVLVFCIVPMLCFPKFFYGAYLYISYSAWYGFLFMIFCRKMFLYGGVSIVIQEPKR